MSGLVVYGRSRLLLVGDLHGSNFFNESVSEPFSRDFSVIGRLESIGRDQRGWNSNLTS